SAPCRGASAYTKPWRKRLRTDPDARRSALKFFRKQGRAAKRGQWSALIGAGRALGRFPFVAEQVLEVVVAPLRWRRGPDDFDAAGNRVTRFACAKSVLPDETLLLDRGGFRFWADIRVRSSTVGFAESVPASNQRDRFLVIHRHAAERLADIPSRSDRVRLSIGPFRIHINQAHLNRAEGSRELAVTAVAFV